MCVGIPMIPYRDDHNIPSPAIHWDGVPRRPQLRVVAVRCLPTECVTATQQEQPNACWVSGRLELAL